MATTTDYYPSRHNSQLQAIWQDALSQVKSLLSDDEYAKLISIGCLEDLTAHVQDLSERYKRRRVTAVLKRMDTFFIELGRFSNVINMYVQTDTKISALIFGTTYMILEVAARHRTYLQNVVSMLDLIQKHFPRLRSYTELFANSQRIEKAVAGLYRELISFCVYAINFLNRNPLVNIVRLAFPRKSFQTKFEETLNSIREHGNWIDVEAFAAFHERARSVNTLRHEELLERISSGMSATSMRSLPRRYRVLPLLENPRFYGRATDLENLAKAFLADPIDRLLIHSIIGLSGVGKSQLALKFIYQNLQNFDGAFWVSADSEFKIVKGFADIANEVDAIEQASTLPFDAVREITKRWFKTTDCKWLLVLDNVNNLDLIHPYLPTGASGRIIITSQNRETMQSPVTTSTWLQPLSPEEGTALFASLLPENIMQEQHALENAARISSACGGLPLALSRAARYVSDSHHSMTDLLQHSASVFKKNSILNKVPLQDYFHKGNLSTLWDPSFDSLSHQAKYLVNLFTFFDSDAIPEDLIQTQRNVNPDLRSRLVDEDGYHESLTILFSRLLVSETKESGRLIMHKLIQTTIENRLTSEETLSFFATALQLINASFPAQENGERLVNRWQQCTQFLPHVLRLLSIYKGSSHEGRLRESYVFGDLLERAAWFLQERGQLDQSTELLEYAEIIANDGLRALQHARTEGNLQTPSPLEKDFRELSADITGQFACVQYAYCKFDSALELWLKSISLKKSLEPPPMSEVCYLLCNAGNAYLNLNRLVEAHELFQESFRIRQEQLQASSDREVLRDPLASNYGCLSACLWQMNRLDEALEMADYSTELCKEVYGENGAVLATCYTTIGNIKHDQGRSEDAEKLFLKALDIRLKELGDHYKTALTLHKVASLVKDKGDIEKALCYLQTAISIFRKFPKHTAGLARSLYYLSTFPDCINSAELRTEAFQVYKKHCPDSTIALSDITVKDFDNLINRLDR